MGGRLVFDYNFSVQKMIASGIPADEFERYFAKAKVGLDKLKQMVDEGTVGFPKLPLQEISALKDYAKDVKGKFNDLIVVGIGGSALGIEMLINALLPFGYNTKNFTERGGFPRCHIADNIDPSKISAILKCCNQDDTLVVVISKSGNTVETAANYSIIHDWLKSKLKDISKHIVVVTDPEKGPLRDYAKVNDLTSFPILSSIGGRFSVLSPVGLLPAVLLGINLDELLLGAKDVVNESYDNVLKASALYLYFMDNKKSINVMMPYSARLEKFGEWFCQLWGESLGKKYTYAKKEITFGTTPVGAVGAIDQHSQIQLFREGTHDKHISFIGVASHDNETTVSGDYHEPFKYLHGIKLGELLNAELKATETALLKSGVPTVKISIPHVNEYYLGQLINFYQFIVPIIGLAVDINPFDQPGVEEAKDYAYGLMKRKGYDEKREELEKLYVKSDEFTV